MIVVIGRAVTGLAIGEAAVVEVGVTPAARIVTVGTLAGKVTSWR
jgi:hypothetical protein